MPRLILPPVATASLVPVSPRSLSRLLIFLGCLGAAPALAGRAAAGSWHKEVRRLRATTVAESEPNNSVSTADSVALGDRATGTVDPAGDVDTWFVDLTAGQILSLDVDAQSAGSPLDPVLSLLAPDGTTLLAFNDDFDGFDSRISFRIPASGRYYVMIRGFGNSGGPAGTYAINFGTVTCAAVGTEREPNGSPGTASPVGLGADATGEICTGDGSPVDDVDYWAFTVPAGTTIELDVDAESLGLLVDPIIALISSDGTTQLAFSDDINGPNGSDGRLQFSIVTAGTYYATVAAAPGSTGNPFPYTLHVRSIAPGPGDPITVRAEKLGRPTGLAVGSTGDLFTSDLIGGRVMRISAQGLVTTFATGIPNPQGIAFDAFGHLLVASAGGTVYRVTPQGQATPFITDAGFPYWVAVALDGRIWLTDLTDQSLRRYSPTGRFEARFDAGSGPGPLAIGPSGEPYFSNGLEIWKLVNGQPRLVLRNEALIGAFAFDVAGNIYAPEPTLGRIKLFSPAGAVLADTFAVGPDGPQAVAFGRDGTGATIARLFATDPRVGRLIEMNPAGVAHPGLPVGQVPPPFTLEDAAAGLLGAGGLSATDAQFLDALGNHNGRYDVGDFQAYLRTLGGLPGAAAAPLRSGSIR